MPASRALPARFDPRARCVCALLFSAAAALVTTPAAVAAALAVALPTALSAEPIPRLVRRLAPVNAFMLFLAIVLPLSVPGRTLVRLGGLAWTREGLMQAGIIAMKGNAIVLCVAAMMGTMDLVTLGHALHHLRVPDKLVHLLLFTVRYTEVLSREYRRLRQAMKVRGFRAGTNLHTYRSIGYLMGMLLVRSVDRSERVLAAMRCRGFSGKFYLLDHFVWRARDTILLVGWVLACAAIALLQVTIR